MTAQVHSIQLQIDATPADAGSKRFIAAITAVKAAVAGLERDTTGAFTGLSKIKIDTTGLTATKSASDRAASSLSKVDAAAVKSSDAMRRLALSSASAWRTSEAQAGRLTSRLSDIGHVDGIAQIEAQLATLKTALGSATTNLGVREARSEYADLANQLNLTSLAAQDAKWTAQQLAIAETNAAKAAQQHASMLDSLRSEFNPLFAASKQYETVLDRINIAEKEGAISATLAGQARAKAAATLQGSSAGFDHVGKAANHMQFQVQNASYQIADFAVQVGMGTSAIRAAGQQLPQLLGGFGVFGAVAGAVVAIGGALLPVLMGGGTAAKTFDTAMGELNATFTAYKDAVAGVNGGTSALRGEFGQAADSAQRFEMQLAQITRIKMETQMSDSVKALAGEMSGVTTQMNNWDSASFLPAAMRSDTIYLAAEATRNLKEEFGLTVNQAKGLSDALNAAKLAKGPEELSAAMSRVVAGLLKAKDEGANLPPSLIEAAQNAVDLGLSADRLASILAPLPAMVGQATGQTDQWARAMSAVGAEVSGILNSLANIAGGVVSNAATRVQIAALDAGKTIKESETEKARSEFNSQQAPLESVARGKGGVSGFIDSGLLAAQRFQFEEGLRLSTALDAKLSAARQRESKSGSNSGGRVQDLGAETGQLAKLSKQMNTRIFELDQENSSLRLLSSGLATNADTAQLMAAAMALNGGQMDSASESTVALYDAQVKLNLELKKNAANPLKDYVDGLPTAVSATRQASADIAATLRDGISGALTGDLDAKALIDGLRHKLADGLAGVLTDKLIGGLADSTGAAMMSTAIITASATGAAMYATAISTGAVASAGAVAGAGLFGFAEGGYSDRAGVGATYNLPPSAFHNAPHYKDGTGNTSGGIPAVLHPNEAVIPLSRGRKIPVEMSGVKGASSGGAAITITNNVSVDGGAGAGGNDAATQAALAEHIATTISLKMQESMATQMRYGGILNPRGR